jgi:dolichol kinase|tara:strand:+ start:95 stop:673 length:579 start_codon:yes stop_codon:yes gene_type:complete
VSKLSFKNEFKRKIVHFASAIIGLSIIYLDREVILPFLIVSAIIFPLLDYMRINNKFVSNFYNSYFHSITRSFESKKLTGASFVFWGALITYILFEPKVAGIALIVMSLADANAAIIGVGYGNTKLLNKSLEGSFAFYVTTFTILYIFKIPLIISLFISVIATFTELIEIPKINDNISIPLSVAFFLSISGV